MWKTAVYGAIFLLLVAGTYLACRVTPEPDASPEAGVVLDLPQTVIGLASKELEASEAEKQILPPDTLVSKRLYSTPSGAEQISCQIVLSGSDRRSIHRPEACLRGQGWTIENGGVVPITLSDGSKLDVMKLVIDRPIQGRDGKQATLRSLYLYWFVSKEMSTPYHHERIKRTYVDLILHNMTHRWAYCIVSAPVLQGFVPGGENEAETLETLKHFISEAAPQFQRIGVGAKVPPRQAETRGEQSADATAG